MESDDRFRYMAVLERLEKACAAAGRERNGVCLAAVSKFHSLAQIEAVAALGQQDFAENYLQEADGKMARLPALRWHFTGHVQTRKASAIAGRFALLHTLDSARLADALEKALTQQKKTQKTLLEVNIGGEAQKAGILAENLHALMEHVLNNCQHLQVEGLMCMPPVFDAGERARPYFAKLRKLRDSLENDFAVALPELSMGMSGDFEWAVMEGASIVRIGTGIFGERPRKTS